VVLGELGLLASHDRLRIGIEVVKLIAGLGHFNLGFGLAKVLLSVASLLVPASNSLRHSSKLGVALVCMGAGSLSLWFATWTGVPKPAKNGVPKVWQ